MKRALITQMRHEWRDNIWMVLGLTIVSLTVWLISLMLVNQAKGLFYPLGADTDDVYSMSMRTLPPDSPDYIDRGEDRRSAMNQDRRNLIANLRRSPYVEAAAFAQNGLPYSLSYMGTGLRLSEEDTIYYSCNVREVSPDMVKVLRMQSLTGKSQDELVEILRRGELLVTNYTLESHAEGNHTPEEMNGNAVLLGGSEMRVGDIIQQVRRSDFDIASDGQVILPINEEGNIDAWQVAVRVKPGMGEKFRQEFESTPAMQKQGNVMLYQLEALNDVGKGMQREQSGQMRLFIGLCLILTFIVALGIMGVFWFRVQQRVGETAIRKVCGATNGDIFRRIISEGLILLSIAVVIMAAIGYPLAKKMFMDEERVTQVDVIAAGCLTVALLAVVITICIWYPAHRATKIDPAIAIKDE